MKNKKRWQKAVFSAFVIWTMLFNSFPVNSQDIVTSDDISGGSSVFAFRQSKKVAQVKTSFRNNTLKGSTGKRTASPKNIRNQANSAARVQRKRTKAIDPNMVATKNLPINSTKGGKNSKNPADVAPIKVASKEEASIRMAGAAETFLDKNDLNNAIAFFQKAVELNPNNENAKLGLSEAYTRKGDDNFEKTSPESAVSFYEQAIKYNNRNSAAYAGLGEASEAVEANDKALFNYEQALVYNPKLTEIYAPLGILYYQKGEIAKSDEYLTKAAAQNTNDIDTQYYLGLLRYKQNRNDEAIAALKKTLQANSNSAEAHFYLGEAYARLNREAEAFTEYNEAVRVDPNYLEAWFDLGVANYNRGNYEEAVNDYQRVIRLKSDYGQAHANLADVYRQMAMDAKDQNRKREFFGLANGSYTLADLFLKGSGPEFNKEKAELYSNWGFCLGRVEKWDNAVKRLNTAVELSPDASDYSNIGWAYQNSAIQDLKGKRDADARMKLENGKVALQKAIALKPKFFPALQNLGSISLDLGDNQGAVNALKSAAELRKDFFPTILSLAIAYRGLNDLDNAAKQFRKVTELNDKFERGWYSLSEIEYRRGNIKEARRAQDKLRDLNPKLADQLNVILSGAVFQNPQNKIENKILEKNPLKKLPKLPF